MKPSEIILQSVLCREAAVNIHPEDPDELFNTCWLAIRERELRDPNWQPRSDPKRYFLRTMKNKKRDWQKRRRSHPLDETPESKFVKPSEPYGIHYERVLIEWLHEPTEDQDLMFLKNILILAMYCQTQTQAEKLAEISHSAFWKYKKIAEKRFYEYYISTNPIDIHGAIMV